MNKRQAKKQFKKRYGYNPNQLAKTLNEIDFTEVAKRIGEALQQVADGLNRIAQDIAQRMNEIELPRTEKYKMIMDELREQYTEESDNECKEG